MGNTLIFIGISIIIFGVIINFFAEVVVDQDQTGFNEMMVLPTEQMGYFLP